MSRPDAGTAAAKLLGTPLHRVSPLGGAAYRVELTTGDQVVAKGHDDPGAVRAEAASLQWLAEAGSVRVPRLRAESPQWLVTDYIVTGSSSRVAAEALGKNLARLHAAGAPAFGSPPPGGPEDASIGLAPMRNVAFSTWAEFYAEQRVEPYLRTAVERGTVSGSDAAIFGRVMDRLDEISGQPEPPARLHGDLWSGNVLWGADGTAWLIDPAAHGGHRETDLAMLHLFGCPHLEHILGAYQDEVPPADGWRERIPLHQLFPLLVHTVLFGAGYAGQAVTAARKSLALA